MIIELRPKSQVTIPAEFIKELSLNPGDKFEAVIQDGVLMFIPVTIYPKSYVEGLKSEIAQLKEQIALGKTPVFKNVDDMLKSLDEE